MIHSFRHIPAVLGTALFSLLAFSSPQASLAATTVVLNPGDDIAAAIKANPSGTNFVLTAGIYSGVSVVPKDDDTFTGQGQVKLVGSTQLKFTQVDGVFVAPATAINTTHGTCQKAFPLCSYPQDLYVDNMLQTQATSLTGLPWGSWYFDRAAGKIYFHSNPVGHDAELGMLPYAFAGAAVNVHISNMMIERYANMGQFGAIGATTTGKGWIVSNCEVRFNHGVGIKLGTNGQILNSFIHHNGELGISLGGASSEAVGNEISFNNYAGYAYGWESGGAKFSGTSDLLVRSNNVHDNNGPGLWTDTDNIRTTYENNTITHNESSGIQHELSFSAIIRNNVVVDNGWASQGWLWGGQISIQNSANAQVYGNTIIVPASGNGIAVINQNRGSGPMGTWVASNNAVYDNTITYETSAGATGLANDTGSHPVLGNSFTSNHYILKAGTVADKHWFYFGPTKWGVWNTSGEDTEGTLGLNP